MEMDISNFIASVGFPITLSMYLLVRIEGKLQILTESINVPALKSSRVSFTKDSGSIKKLIEFLSYHKIGTNGFITFLLNLNTLRSNYTSAHRIDSGEKKDLEKAKSYIGLKVENMNYMESSVNLFSLASEAFEELISLI